MKKQIPLIVFLLSFSGINAQQYTISGNIEGLEGGVKIYLMDVLNQVFIDSAISKPGSFTMKGMLTDEPSVLWLEFQQNKESYYTTIIIKNEQVRINTRLKDFPHSVYTEGSKTGDVHNILKRKTAQNWILRDSFMREYFSVELQNDTSAIAKSKRRQLLKQVDLTDSLIDAANLSFLKQNIHSFAGLMVLFHKRMLFSTDSIAALLNTVEPEFKESTYGLMLDTYLKVGDVLKVGDNYYDFEAQDTEGVPRKLSEFTGKYILLDFATTYCAPCIQSVDELRQMQTKYKNQLTIVTVNADKSKDIWLKGHKRDNPLWLSLWDGRGYAGKAVLKYGATAWPTFVLINPEGKIIHKSVGFGKGKIEKMLNEKIQL